MVSAELKWGANITELTPKKVVLETRVMSCLDHSEFSGNREEMEPLFMTAAAYLKAHEHEDVIREKAAEAGANLKNIFLFTMAAPLLIGANRLKTALLLGLGMKTKEELKKGLEFSFNDLIAICELMGENPKMSFEELSQLAV